MAGVAKGLSRLVVAQKIVGSNPTTRPDNSSQPKWAGYFVFHPIHVTLQSMLWIVDRESAESNS